MEENPKESFKKRYSILNRISEGNFGCVYKAMDNQTNSPVALKKLFVSSRNQKQRAIVDREIQILSSLDHPNVKETSITLVLEYCEQDIFSFLEQIIYPIDNELTKNIGYQILQGLAHVHKNNIIHRDLKPQNILINDKGQVKIGDFGSAIRMTEDIEFEIEGFTRWYKSPEQLFGSRSYDCSIDMWAYGCIMAEMMQGFPLFTSMNEIEQISKIAEILGSPDEENWKSIVTMPDFGKINFQKNKPKDLKEVLSNQLQEEIKFLQRIVRYEDRMTSEEALKDGFFEGISGERINIQKCKDFENEKYVQVLDYTKIL